MGSYGNRGLIVSCLAMLVMLCAAQVARGDITLVENGKSDYVVVWPPGASPSEQWAAQELISHIKQMSGVELKVQRQFAGDTPKAIYIGVDPHIASLIDVEDKSLGDDGFAIRTAGQDLIIDGGRKRGTMYGVYTLLEKLGVRWWYPGETFVPKKATIVVPEMNLIEVPKLEYRDMMFSENYNASGHLWAARNKVNGMAWDDPGEKLGGHYKFVGNLVHSYNQLMTSSGMEVKPEMWAMRDGKRKPKSQPCLTNPDVLKAITISVLRHFRENPDAEFVVVGQNDNRNYCQCENCAAIDKKEESHAGQVIAFANKVAEAVEKEVPGAKITTAAYHWSRKPPAHIRPRDNVYITLCSIECDFAHPLADASNPENKSFKEDIEGWSKIAKKIFIWHYVGNRDHYLMPNAELDTLVPNMKFFADNGVVGIFNQGLHKGRGTDMVPLKMWLLAKAMWNPDLDSRELTEQFVNGYYGPAGPAIQKYIDIIHAIGRKQDFHNGRRVRLNALYLNPKTMAEAEVALREAEKLAAGKPEFERRVRHAHMGVWYVLAKRGPGTATWKAVEAKVGKLNLADISANLERVVADYRIKCITDPDPVRPWLDWLKQYAGLLAEKGSVVPPELADAAPGSYRLVQACQMDGYPEWWKATEGASDGWAVHVPKPRWHTKYYLSKWDDFRPGKQYKLYVRAKGDLKPDAQGEVEVWEFGVYPKGKTLQVKADQLSDGKWRVFELGPWKAVEGQYFWTALRRNPGAKSVAIDCLWLEEVKE